MRGYALALIFPLLAGSALAQTVGPTLDDSLKAAVAEQASADAEAGKLELAASKARGEADRLHAEQAAAAQSIEAAEARISVANARLQLAAAQMAAHRKELAIEQQPASSLLAGLATMARRPPLLAVADQGGSDELVKVRLLLASTLPVIRSRTARLSAQLNEDQRLQQTALAARAELGKSRENLLVKRRHYGALEEKAVQLALSSGGQALGAGDVAIAAGESVEQLRGQQANSQSIRSVASLLANSEPTPASPFAPEGADRRPPFAYQLPAAGDVVEGLSSVDSSGVRSRGITIATSRGVALSAPAAGTVKFAGPFRDYDGVLIIDHGGGWMTLIVNVGSPLRAGERIGFGDPIGRSLGPLVVELSHNGRRISPALIAGSSQNLSKPAKAG